MEETSTTWKGNRRPSRRPEADIPWDLWQSSRSIWRWGQSPTIARCEVSPTPTSFCSTEYHATTKVGARQSVRRRNDPTMPWNYWVGPQSGDSFVKKNGTLRLCLDPRNLNKYFAIFITPHPGRKCSIALGMVSTSPRLMPKVGTGPNSLMNQVSYSPHSTLLCETTLRTLTFVWNFLRADG
jgi:hypothetical protein